MSMYTELKVMTDYTIWESSQEITSDMKYGFVATYLGNIIHFKFFPPHIVFSKKKKKLEMVHLVYSLMQEKFRMLWPW